MEEIKKLYELYSQDIFKFILSLTLNSDIAEDIMQSTFLSAMKSIHTFKGHSSVKTWLIGIAKYEYYAYIRKHPIFLSLDEITYNQSTDRYQLNEDYYVLMEEIAKLPDLEKTIVILRLVNDFTFREIGTVIGKSENFCRVSFFRSKQKLVEGSYDESK